MLDIDSSLLRALVIAAGIATFLVAAAGCGVPRVLRWREDLARLRPLNRQIFWTYSGYILCTNLCMAVLATFAPGLLLSGTPLAAAVSGYICVYWGARLVIQFVYYDRSDAPNGAVFEFAHYAFAAIFLYLTVVFGACCLANAGAP